MARKRRRINVRERVRRGQLSVKEGRALISQHGPIPHHLERWFQKFERGEIAVQPDGQVRP